VKEKEHSAKDTGKFKKTTTYDLNTHFVDKSESLKQMYQLLHERIRDYRGALRRICSPVATESNSVSTTPEQKSAGSRLAFRSACFQQAFQPL
jgi:hypothetical protein